MYSEIGKYVGDDAGVFKNITFISITGVTDELIQPETTILQNYEHMSHFHHYQTSDIQDVFIYMTHNDVMVSQALATKLGQYIILQSVGVLDNPDKFFYSATPFYDKYFYNQVEVDVATYDFAGQCTSFNLLLA